MSNTKRDNGVEWRRSSCCLFLNQALYFWDMTQTCDIQSVLLAWTACSAQLRSIYCISPCDMLMFLWAGSTRECSRSPFAVQLEPPKQKTARTSQPSRAMNATRQVLSSIHLYLWCAKDEIQIVRRGSWKGQCCHRVSVLTGSFTLTYWTFKPSTPIRNLCTVMFWCMCPFSQ